MESLSEMVTIKPPEIKSNEEELELYSEEYPFRLPLRIKNFETEADFAKFVKNCEKLVRGSVEYRLWKNYIEDVLQIDNCAITNETRQDCTVEVHHHLPSLYTLVSAIISEKIAHDQEFSTFDICLESIKLHFMNKIGYVTLISSMHEKFHNGLLNIPMKLVHGDYRYFLEKFSKYLDESELDVINQRLSIVDIDPKWKKDEYPAGGTK
jgi:hypothetical protein